MNTSPRQNEDSVAIPVRQIIHGKREKEVPNFRTLITGGSGFIASNLVKNLEAEGDEVFNYDLKTGHDILNLTRLSHTFLKFNPDRVFHLAAQAFLAPGEKDPYMDVDVNVKGMINMLRCLDKFRVPMVYTSSGAVYGITPTIPQREDAHCMPMSNYGISKLAAEQYLKKWVKTKGVDARIVRFSSVYGAGRLHGPVNIFINQALQGKPITVFGDGSHTRDLTYIDDAVHGVKIALSYGMPGEVYNIGSGVETSVGEVAYAVAAVIATEVLFKPHEFNEFDLPRSFYDVTKAKKLGFAAAYNLYDGIAATIQNSET